MDTKNRPHRVFIAVIAFVSLQFSAYAQAGGGVFQEIGASYGAALNPQTVSAATIDYGIGQGKNTVRFEIGMSSFGNCGFGTGPSQCVQNANYSASVSSFRLTDVSVNYQRDLYHPAQSRLDFYGGMGMGYFKSTYTKTTECGIFCFSPIPLITQTSESINSVGFGINSGFGIAVWRGIGLRSGLEAWLVPGNTANGTSTDTLVRVTFGLYYRHKW